MLEPARKTISPLPLTHQMRRVHQDRYTRENPQDNRVLKLTTLSVLALHFVLTRGSSADSWAFPGVFIRQHSRCPADIVFLRDRNRTGASGLTTSFGVQQAAEDAALSPEDSQTSIPTQQIGNECVGRFISIGRILLQAIQDDGFQPDGKFGAQFSRTQRSLSQDLLSQLLPIVM